MIQQLSAQQRAALQEDGYDALRRYAHHLVGSTKGQKPVIKLKDHSQVEDDILIFYSSNKGAASTYAATFRGIDIDMGNNSAVSAISMETANLSTIEDVTIRGNFHVGLIDFPAVGAGTTNVRIIGGKIGVWQRNNRPNPSINGLYLENQSQCGVQVSNSRGPLTITGFKIISPVQPAPEYRAVYLENTRGDAGDSSFGNLNLIDGTIEVRGEQGKAIENVAQDIMLTNVYMKADTLIESGANHPPANILDGKQTKWQKVSEYYFGSQLDQSTVFFNHQDRRTNRDENFVMYTPLADENPTVDFIAKHVWDAATMPSWEDEQLVDITSYGATPGFINSRDDDGKAIQQAIDDTTTPGNANYGKAVFIPRGNFHIHQTLTLKKGTKLIGAGKTLSIVQLSKQAALAGIDRVMDTVNVPEGNIILSDLCIYGYPGTLLLSIQSGNSLVRDVQTEVLDHTGIRVGMLEQPYILFSENAGGKIYGLSLSSLVKWDYKPNDKTGPGAWRSRELLTQPGPDYGILMIKNTKQPLNLYMFTITHLIHSPMVHIRSAENVYFYSIKFESVKELMHISNSRNIKLFGSYGLSGLDYPEDTAMFRIANSRDVWIANMNRRSNDAELQGKGWVVNGNDFVTDDYPLLMYKDSSALEYLIQ
jgi:hypothetical protein